MNRKLIFQGSAGEALGTEWSVNAPTVADAFRIVHANNPKNYRDYFEQDLEAEFTVKLAGESLDAAELLLHNLEGEDIVVTPIPKGSKNAVEKILIAIVLIVISIYLGPEFLGEGEFAKMLAAGFKDFLMMMGTNLALQGIAELMAPDPSNDKDEEGAMFSGPAQTVKHGQPVPICYGKMMVGGSPITYGFGVNKLEPTNGLVFSSDNPNAWDGEIYSNDANLRNGDNGGHGGGGQDGDDGTWENYEER